jgi:sugar phosphate isomerase/epimerase
MQTNIPAIGSAMHISIATANFYYLPFKQALAIIAGAGFTDIELALYWEHGAWAMAQHLRELSAKEIVRAIVHSGMRVTSIHDGGGVLCNAHSIEGFINPYLDKVLDELGYAPESIVFHTPHIKGSYDHSWWDSIAEQIGRSAASYHSDDTDVTLENMPPFTGYTVPLGTPSELREHAVRYGLGVTLDTTHYAQMGIEITSAAHILGDRVRTIHLSDFYERQTHLFPGEGVLDFSTFFRSLPHSALRSITLESTIGFAGEDVGRLDQIVMTSRLGLARRRIECWLETSQKSAPGDRQK